MSQNTQPLSADDGGNDSLPSVYEDRRLYIERLEKANLDLEQRIQQTQTAAAALGRGAGQSASQCV